MQQSRALLDEYKLHDGPVLLHPSTVGFDLCNRDGVPIDGARCDALLEQMATMGWDPEKANHGNVCVQARPGSAELFDYSHRACEDAEFLAPVTGDNLAYGTLSHSHFHQCLKNLVGGAKAEKPT